MRYGSVCSGIEAASVAWEPLGMTPAWFSEIEAFPSAVLAHHWPDVKNLGDMTKISRRILLGEIEAPDVLVGGTPCQAFSVAGMREGMADARGQLTMKYVELANAIDTVRTRAGNAEAVIVWENVPGVLSDRQNAFGCFLGALAGEDRELQPSGKKWTNAGCVYGPQRAVAWRVLDAQYFGVAQRRRRVFVVASARADFDPAAVLFERESVRRDTPPSRSQAQDATQDAGAGFTASSFGQYQPGVGTLRSQGGDIGGGSETIAVHPHCIGRAATAGPQGKEYLEDGAAYTCDARGVAQAVACTVALRGREGGATAELGGEIATALRASTGGGDKPHILTVHGTQDPCVSDSTAFSLGRNNGGENAVLNDLVVRRLTPTEAERLQGFPDSHTAVLYRNKPAADGPRYKAIGNSMAVPCMAWIGSRLTALMGVRHAS
ncbi:DNA cytosine methyltransferase [Halomonas sp. 5021]|uniref:DNA cytosine methyltransferase n=1 Tax=Halomonas sp. 5021 TaxID=3082156 RepID=UPI002FC58B96